MTTAVPPVQVTFSPSWWHARFGLSQSERVLTDAVARTELEQEERRLLHDVFGDVGLGEADPAPAPAMDGAYGHRFMSALWGCDIVYMPDQAPAAIPLPDGIERVLSTDASQFGRTDVARRALSDADVLRRRFGRCAGGVNMGGALNNAVSVIGETILALCASDAATAGAVLHRMAEACAWVDQHLTQVVDGSSGTLPWPSGSIGNCPVCMLSPGMYERVVLPVDLWHRGHYRDLGLHHCGVFHPYCAAYARLAPAHIDVGWGSDLREIRRHFPTTSMSIEIQAKAVAHLDEAGIDALVSEQIRAASPIEHVTHLWVAEIGPEVTDEVVRSLVTAPIRCRSTFEPPHRV